MGVGLSVPVPMLVILGLACVVLDLVLVVLEGQVVALEGVAAYLAQQGVGMLEVVVVQVVLLLLLLLIYVHWLSTCNTYYNLLRKNFFLFC